MMLIVLEVKDLSSELSFISVFTERSSVSISLITNVSFGIT